MTGGAIVRGWGEEEQNYIIVNAIQLSLSVVERRRRKLSKYYYNPFNVNY